MFSSKIIRSGAESAARTVSFGPLGAIPLSGGAPFVATSFASAGAPAAETAGELLPPEPPPCITEEEAMQRADAAYEEGLREGRRYAEAELSSVSEGLAKALIAAGELRQELLHEAEDDLLKLAVALARTIIMREISIDPAILGGIVQGAVEVVSACDEVVVRLSPDDHEVVAQSPEFAALVSEKKRITLKGDPAVERGGCLVETTRGNVDARLESQLDELYRRLVEERSSRRDEVEPH